MQTIKLQPVQAIYLNAVFYWINPSDELLKVIWLINKPDNANRKILYSIEQDGSLTRIISTGDLYDTTHSWHALKGDFAIHKYFLYDGEYELEWSEERGIEKVVLI